MDACQARTQVPSRSIRALAWTPGVISVDTPYRPPRILPTTHSISAPVDGLCYQCGQSAQACLAVRSYLAPLPPRGRFVLPAWTPGAPAKPNAGSAHPLGLVDSLCYQHGHPNTRASRLSANRHGPSVWTVCATSMDSPGRKRCGEAGARFLTSTMRPLCYQRGQGGGWRAASYGCKHGSESLHGSVSGLSE